MPKIFFCHLGNRGGGKPEKRRKNGKKALGEASAEAALEDRVRRQKQDKLLKTKGKTGEETWTKEKAGGKPAVQNENAPDGAGAQLSMPIILQ